MVDIPMPAISNPAEHPYIKKRQIEEAYAT
jgi:hypothetical protein